MEHFDLMIEQLHHKTSQADPCILYQHYQFYTHLYSHLDSGQLTQRRNYSQPASPPASGWQLSGSGLANFESYCNVAYRTWNPGVLGSNRSMQVILLCVVILGKPLYSKLHSLHPGVNGYRVGFAIVRMLKHQCRMAAPLYAPQGVEMALE